MGQKLYIKTHSSVPTGCISPVSHSGSSLASSTVWSHASGMKAWERKEKLAVHFGNDPVSLQWLLALRCVCINNDFGAVGGAATDSGSSQAVLEVS